MSDSKIQVRCTSSFTFGGTIVRPGDIVELSRAEAANLLHRGRVELVDAADAPDVSDAAEAANLLHRGRVELVDAADAPDVSDAAEAAETAEAAQTVEAAAAPAAPATSASRSGRRRAGNP